jgi:hypothetical protein
VIDAKDLVEALDLELGATLELHRAQSLGDWLAPEHECSYLVGPHLRMAHHFDLDPAVLIRDSALGTLGIVETVLPGRRDAQDRPMVIAEQVRRHVDAATYTRHLLLRDPVRRGAAALSVELVLLTRAAPATADEIGEALRDLLRKSDSLFHVGIGVLTLEAGRRPTAVMLRRAMPWLLTATRKWLASSASRVAAAAAAPTPGHAPVVPAPAPSPPGRRLQRLSLSNYRLPGRRELVLAPASVHLVHGPNGSGKSSLVEAIELLSCGLIERLEQAGEKDYARIIKNRDADPTATATVEWAWGDKDDEKHVRNVERKDPSPGEPVVQPGSFRLDQVLMERLVGSAAHERANTYLRAFFAEAGPSLDTYAGAVSDRETSRAALRKHMEDLRLARKALEDVQVFRGGGGAPTQESPARLLNRWLERTALADLTERALGVQATLKAAYGAGWSLPQEAAAGLLSLTGAAPEDLQAQATRWREEVGTLQGRLNALRPASSLDQAASTDLRALTPAQSKALNDAGRLLFEDAVIKGRPFGDTITLCIGGGGTTAYGSITIGTDAWASTPMATLDQMIEACKVLVETERTPPAWPGPIPLAEYESARKHQEAVLASGAELNQKFLSLLGDEGTTGADGCLIAAVNELLALFTPARWGYSDIRLPSRLGDGRPGVEITLGAGPSAVRAELHFNTAELNLFTVALFLLCAGRVHKPLGLLVLDDPLQNMDEMTSTALARGLSKILRLWRQTGRKEELLLLFHGYEDLDRFQSELAAATYRLPWLSPGRGPERIVIPPDRTPARDTGVQQIAHLLEVRPPSPA